MKYAEVGRVLLSNLDWDLVCISQVWASTHVTTGTTTTTTCTVCISLVWTYTHMTPLGKSGECH